MDAFGLRPRLEEMAGRLAGWGYAVLVPNVFYRSGRTPVVELGDLSVPETRSAAFEKLGPVMQALTPDRAMRDADAYLAFLGTDERVSRGPVGTVGYCMGGALALRTAAHAPDRVAAVASFHGGRLATDRPTACTCWQAGSPGGLHRPRRQRRLDAPEQQERLAKALTEAGVRNRTELYAGAAHGFTMADTAAYDEAATERHWDRLTDLFERTLH